MRTLIEDLVDFITSTWRIKLLFNRTYKFLLTNAPIFTLILMLLITVKVLTYEAEEVTYNNYATPETLVTSELTPQEQEVPSTLRAFVEDYCKYYNVSKELVYAVMSTTGYDTKHAALGDDDKMHYGIMAIHVDLISVATTNNSWGLDIVESSYSNVAYGIQRLEWAITNNESLEGALMAYYYTKPVAQSMWNKGIATTPWVEKVKGGLGND